VLLSGGLWLLTAPGQIDPTALSGINPDIERGRTIFNIGGCASCHSAESAEGDSRLVLSGGRKFPSDFGTFYAPNISPDPENGIGTWTALDVANALLHGTSPRGRHYYPVFPYTSYAQMNLTDVVSLHAYLQTLPVSDQENTKHDVGFPFNIRRVLGLWKLMFTRNDWVVDGELTEEQQLGRYLAEGPGHCAECHTPRNILGGLLIDRWLGGAPNPSGKGKIPNLTPGGLQWSERDIAEYLKSGFTPDFDTAGSEMADVIENTSQLSDEERAAIAAYLKIVPALSD